MSDWRKVTVWQNDKTWAIRPADRCLFKCSDLCAETCAHAKQAQLYPDARPAEGRHIP